jgi:hypothetical protein
MTEPLVSHERWVDVLRARAGSVPEQRHRNMIDTFIEHMVSERSGDVDRFMATMVDDCVYRTWGTPRPHGTAPSVRDAGDVRARYEAMMLHRPGGFPEFEMDVERFWVGDDGIAMDGVLYRLHRVDELAEIGEQPPPGARPDDEVVLSRRTAVFVSFRDGLMVGEDLYYDSSSEVTLIDEVTTRSALPGRLKS